MRSSEILLEKFESNAACFVVLLTKLLNGCGQLLGQLYVLGWFNLSRKSFEFALQCVQDAGSMMILPDGSHGGAVKREEDREFEEHVTELISEKVEKMGLVIDHGLLGGFVQCSNVGWHSILY